MADDPKGKAARALWNEQKEDPIAGRTPRSKLDELTVAGLCNHFCTAKLDLLNAGEIAQRTCADYYATCDRLALES